MTISCKSTIDTARSSPHERALASCAFTGRSASTESLWWTDCHGVRVDAEIGLADLRSRCVMTTYDPETAEQDPGVLRDIVRRFRGQLCLNAAVTRAGRVEIGHSVELIAP